MNGLKWMMKEWKKERMKEIKRKSLSNKEWKFWLLKIIFSSLTLIFLTHILYNVNVNLYYE